MTFSNVERAKPPDCQGRPGLGGAATITRLAASVFITIALAACTTTATPSPGPGVVIDGVRVVCDPGPVWPLAPTCSSAIAVALPASLVSPAAIDFVEYHYGAYCTPGAPCASASPNVGYVVMHLQGGAPEVRFSLSADASGKVTLGP